MGFLGPSGGGLEPGMLEYAFPACSLHPVRTPARSQPPGYVTDADEMGSASGEEGGSGRRSTGRRWGPGSETNGNGGWHDNGRGGGGDRG